jgi:hypothetical protein
MSHPVQKKQPPKQANSQVKQAKLLPVMSWCQLCQWHVQPLQQFYVFDFTSSSAMQ